VRVGDSLARRPDQKDALRPPLQAAVSASQAKEGFFRILQQSRSSSAAVGVQTLEESPAPSDTISKLLFSASGYIPEESPAPADGSFFLPAGLLPTSASVASGPLTARSWTSESSSEAGHFQAMIPHRTLRRPASVPPLLIPGTKASFEAERGSISGQSTDVSSCLSSCKSLQVSKPCPPMPSTAGDCCSVSYVDESRSYGEKLPLDEVSPTLDAEALRRVKDYLKSQSELSGEYWQEQLQVASNTQKRAGLGGA
jgi:hypothetical protein